MTDIQASGASKTVRVELGARSYDILIGPGILARAGEEIARRAPGIRAAIVTDETVAPLYLARMQDVLRQAGIASSAIVMPAGEATKSLSCLGEVVDSVLADRLERGDTVIALGGGVIGDLAGFAAGIVRRGMRFIQIPTTLLAQVDSSVGGKTGINSPRGKNLIGVFYQPQLVLADTEVLSTLSPREFRAGYAEVVKYGLIDQPEFFEWLEQHHAAVFAGGPERVEAVARCCAAKAAVVAGDEQEHGNRALLNLGHTFGHALEAAANYDSARLVHGEGVAIGMALAHRFSAQLGLISGQDATRAVRHLQTVGLPTEISQIPGPRFTVDLLMDKIAQDKKVSKGKLTFILTRGLGQSFVARDISAEKVSEFLAGQLDAPA
ncbi:3-dehydroquinate synthase [Aureimonas fodinaquatilis]|uniref:3-dehydroquinate synthase n=1 Tax=Aureimonas fodinaquatilis TaxID=2565783 RepID=A0A5B0DYU2_9HYPH|nr:3-dehydroquinate synthase [Aureimonas fodinaquatilis]KAA0971606.1 3-dehydroquinate synthase [Aureimonas fodinaquatilis]